MGNCLVVEDKSVIKITRIDGKILEYRSPMKVHQVLSEFPGHSITDALPVVCRLDPVAELCGGHLYYLLQQPKKAEPTVKAGAVRVKIVISKQELKEMLEREGLTLEDIMSQIQKQQKIPGYDRVDRCMGWKPDLESIPEGNDL